MRADSAALPQGPSLRSRFCCPGPSSLIRPHPPHSRAHPDFTDSRLIPNAFAVHICICPRRPTTGSELSLMLSHNMSPSSTTGNPSAAYTQYFTESAGLQLRMKVSAFPSSSHSDSGEGKFSRLNYGSLALRPAALLALLSELTRFASSQRGPFTSGLPTVWSPAPSPDITTVPTGQFALAGLSPARPSTSFTAPYGSYLGCLAAKRA